jgi:hypothetical protein
MYKLADYVAPPTLGRKDLEAWTGKELCLHLVGIFDKIVRSY